MSTRSPTSLTALPFALAFSATGCEASPDAGVASGAQIEDSAGIVIVSNPRPAPDSRLGWQVGPEPIVSIGTVEGGDDFQLFRVDDALKLRDGRIVVANGGSHQLLVFDADGNYLTAWGRRGEGPGDFGGTSVYGGLSPGLFRMARWPSDSLAVCHPRTPVGPRHSVSIWDTGGRHARTLNLEGAKSLSECRDLLPSGAVLASRWLEPPPPYPAGDPRKGLYRQELELFVVAGDGSPSGSLGPHRGAETFVHWEGHISENIGLFVITDPPFQKSLVWSAWNQLVLVAPTDHYELRAHRHDGSLARIVRREHDVRSPTQADLGARREAEAPKGELTDFARSHLGAWNALPLPESFPAFSAIEVDLLGNLWVREYNLPEDEDRALWTVFDPEGVALGFIETPPGLVIYEIGEDYILGKTEDELGVEYVQVRELARSL